MKGYKDYGIIFKQININEVDRIVSILTKYHRRVDSIAKGIRKISSRKSGSIDIMNLSYFYFNKGKNFDYIIEVKLINNFSNLKLNLKSLFNLFYICELLDNFIKTSDKQPEIFLLTLSLLKFIHSNNKEIIIRSYELKLLALLGYRPNLYTCLKCNKKFKKHELRYLSNEYIGFICCNNKKPKNDISSKSIKIMRYLLNSNLSQAQKIIIDKNTLRDIKYINNFWIECIIEKNLNSIKFI